MLTDDLNNKLTRQLSTSLSIVKNEPLLQGIAKPWKKSRQIKSKAVVIYKSLKEPTIENLQTQSEGYFANSVERLKSSIAYFEQKLSDLTYWYGSITREDAEKYLDRKPEHTFLLRKSSQEGYIVVSSVCNKNQSRGEAIILDKKVPETVFLSSNQQFKPKETNKVDNNFVPDQQEVFHKLFRIFEDLDKMIKIEAVVNNISNKRIFASINAFDKWLRRHYIPLQHQPEPIKLSSMQNKIS